MPTYLIRGYDVYGTLQAEEEFDCSDDELHDEFSDRVIQPAYLGCHIVQAFELKPVKSIRDDEVS